MQIGTYHLSFDAGHEVDVEVKSRDLAKLERLGITFDEEVPIGSTYRIVFTALQRMKRTGQIDFDLPDSAEDLEDIADFNLEGGDDEGEAGGQEPTPGKQPL